LGSTPSRARRGWLLALGAILLIAVCYVALALSPSHYQIGLSKLGVDVQPLWGVARPIRSDDWMVFTPLTQLAVRGGFSSHDQVSPYGQSLKIFMPLPIADWSLMFKPQLWCYWVLPPAYAYSAYWAIMWCSMLIGYALLLRECRVPVALAILGSGTLWMTHYVQVWWVGPAPAFALAPWPAVILASSMKPWLKWILLPYITAVWMLGVVYPPYQIPTTLALGALLVGLRRDILALKSRNHQGPGSDPQSTSAFARLDRRGLTSTVWAAEVSTDPACRDWPRR